MVSGTGTSKRLAALAGSAGFWGVGFGVSAAFAGSAFGTTLVAVVFDFARASA